MTYNGLPMCPQGQGANARRSVKPMFGDV